MELFLIVALVIVVAVVVAKVLSSRQREESEIQENLPYQAKDSILTDAEKSFYNNLKQCVGNRGVIFPKVGLKDVIFVSKGAGNEYMKWLNKINKKHVDFLICEPVTMKPLGGIELDDFSHTQKNKYERDVFVEQVYKSANLELIRFSAKSGYTVSEIEEQLALIFDSPSNTENEEQTDDQTNVDEIKCPKCNIPMVQRKATKGKNAGKEFYGCPNYPDCTEIKNFD